MKDTEGPQRKPDSIVKNQRGDGYLAEYAPKWMLRLNLLLPVGRMRKEKRECSAFTTDSDGGKFHRV